MTVAEVIKAAMRKAGVISFGETPETDRYSEALQALQSMLRSWASRRIYVFASNHESFPLVAAKASYSWGTGGNITTSRPYQILGAVVRDSSSQDYPLEIISEGEYRNICAKTTQGRPEYAFYHPLFPLAYLYLFPTPDATETVWIDSLKPFTEASSFSAITDTISFPGNYEEPIIYNLAIRIAPEMGASIPPEVSVIARDSLKELQSLNAANQISTASLHLEIPVGFHNSTYDINAG